MPYIFMAYTIMNEIVMAYTVMAYTVMNDIVMAYIVMASAKTHRREQASLGWLTIEPMFGLLLPGDAVTVPI